MSGSHGGTLRWWTCFGPPTALPTWPPAPHPQHGPAQRPWDSANEQASVAAYARDISRRPRVRPAPLFKRPFVPRGGWRRYSGKRSRRRRKTDATLTIASSGTYPCLGAWKGLLRLGRSHESGTESRARGACQGTPPASSILALFCRPTPPARRLRQHDWLSLAELRLHWTQCGGAV